MTRHETLELDIAHTLERYLADVILELGVEGGKVMTVKIKDVAQVISESP